MGIVEMMKFDSEVSLSRGAWWGWTLGLLVVQIVVGIVLAIASIFEGGIRVRCVLRLSVTIEPFSGLF